MPKARQRRTTLQDIADAAGVSTATVSLALNDKGNLPASRKRQIQKIAEKMKYRPSFFGRGLRSGQTSCVGMIVNYLSNSFFHGIFQGVESFLEGQKYDFWVSQAHDDREREYSLALRMADQGVEGLIVHPSSNNNEHLQKIKDEFGIPIVLIAHAHPGFTSIVADDYNGTHIAMQHLLSLKRSKILHIAGPQERTAVRERCRVYIEVMNRYDQNFVPDDDICYLDRLTTGSGYAAMKLLLLKHRPPVAVLASNDVTAFGAARYCHEQGYTMPEDVALLSFGGTPLIDQLGLGISSVDIPFFDIGRTAAQSVFACIAEPQQALTPKIISLPTTLTVRNSTKIGDR